MLIIVCITSGRRFLSLYFTMLFIASLALRIISNFHSLYIYIYTSDDIKCSPPIFAQVLLRISC